MRTEVCKHELLTSECSLCKRPKQVALIKYKPTAIEAKYYGKCADCGQTIMPGDYILRKNITSAAYSHEGC